ncbi:Ger(x)C family spore germination protein [Paenibacillus arenilitoris]|uniref:Ger(X)C family spore germination protein n=1 Tax=Paenibacillus arenilitoris TaxID=2772299 RepID=A0A927CK31_9BACL|nr:Ger(x)C family spore germination protein [Paenibacillus arenilitoris]MBD2868920.1 Ger(x)C family spore germination protein [Paenibacillus arenilitoris]
MGRTLTLLGLAAALLLLPGCWSKYELTDRGFVMGVALDLGKTGKIDMLTQVYRPASVDMNKTTATGVSSINIKTSDDTVNEAIRDIPLHLGRKAQWSHLRVIIVGERLARTMPLGKLLDLFYRDHEPRSSVSLMISKGRAADLLEKKPLIEQTSAQQFLRTEEASYKNSAKTVDTSLLKFMLESKGATRDAAVAYVYESKEDKNMFSAAGLALFKNGVMKTVMPASKVEGLLMLRNKYKSGIVEFPCEGSTKEMETVEVLSLNVKARPGVKDGRTSVSVAVEGNVSIGELKCTKIVTLEDEAAYLGKVEQAVKKQLESAISFLQKNQMDVIGIGNKIYRKNPGMWKKMEKDWGRQFAAIPFQFEVKLRLMTSGTTIGKPAV